jgi:CRP-like cAMP-binding protein
MFLKDDHVLAALPLALKTEVLVSVYDDLVQKSKLFELGDPSFCMVIVRYLFPKLFMAGDDITRVGEVADEFYFIRSGMVEVRAADEEVTITFMEEGEFFGEIGVLLSNFRSTNVTA